MLKPGLESSMIQPCKFKVYEENLFWYKIFTIKIQILHTGLFIGFNKIQWKQLKFRGLEI